MQKITPFLWFNGNLEEAIDFYSAIFKNVKVDGVSRMPDGKIMTASFEIEGQKFLALDGGPMFQFTEAISFFINCVDQEEVDFLWEKLSEGGSKSRCGWLKDKFGLSWQVIPDALGQLMGDPDREKAGRVMQAMMTMSKINIAELQAAYDGK